MHRFCTKQRRIWYVRSKISVHVHACKSIHRQAYQSKTTDSSNLWGTLSTMCQTQIARFVSICLSKFLFLKALSYIINIRDLQAFFSIISLLWHFRLTFIVWRLIWDKAICSRSFFMKYSFHTLLFNAVFLFSFVTSSIFPTVACLSSSHSNSFLLWFLQQW